jgi:hypothetical protein
MTARNNQITAPRVDFLDQNGKISREWYMYLYNLYTITGSGSGITPIINGGTGLGTLPTNGQLLIGNDGVYSLNTLGAGAGVSVTNGPGTIVLANTGVLSNIAGTGISVSGATGNVTIANTGVLSVTGISPVVSSGGANPAISLASGYGDTQNPYAAKTANYVLAGPASGAAAVPTFRGLVVADIPALPYAPQTSGTSILYGNGTGGFSNVTIGSGISFAAGTLSATGSGGTVTSVAALTLGTTGTDLSSTVANSTTTPVITLNVPTASATNRGALSSADWTTFNNKQPAGTYVTSVTGTAPVVSSGGTTPAISMAAANTTTNGYLTSTDWNTFNGKGSGTVTSVSFTGGIISVATATTTPALTVAGTSGGIPYFASGTTWASSGALTQYGVVYGGGAGAAPVATAAGTTGQVLTATTGGAPTWAAPATSGTVTSVSVVSANGFAGTVATATTTPAITLTTSITGLLYGNGTALAAATISAPLAYSAGTLSITQSNTSTNGYLSSTDWNTFNNKQAVSAPVTKTADFSVATTDLWLINNKSGSTCTVTLPAASSYSGRVLHFQNYQAQTLISASSNVVPLAGGAAGTSILLASAGDSATLVSDGSNWLMTQYVPNNILLLE